VWAPNWIDNPNALPSEAELTELAKARGIENLPRIQFSQDIYYTQDTLKALNRLCQAFGKHLNVRFYTHSKGGFDASVLKALPDVRSLSIDCIEHINNPDEIFKLAHLQAFGFGVRTYKNPDFLKNFDLSTFECLSLKACHSRSMDLSSLAEAKNMSYLWLERHHVGIEAVAKMPKLKSLSLISMPKGVNLNGLSDCASLEYLRLLRVTPEAIVTISSQSLRVLEICRSRGLDDLGDLSRFPNLEVLNIEDQIQLTVLTLDLPRLRELSLMTCKTLSELHGLDQLKNLEQFRVIRTALDLEALTKFSWPETLKSLTLHSGLKKRDAEIEAALKTSQLSASMTPFVKTQAA